MGKKKLDNKVKIENIKKRQVSFYKRSRGIATKLLELHNLCGANVFSIIISDTGKMTVVKSRDSSSDLINKYNSMDKTKIKMITEYENSNSNNSSKIKDKPASLPKLTSIEPPKSPMPNLQNENNYYSSIIINSPLSSNVNLTFEPQKSPKIEDLYFVMNKNKKNSSENEKDNEEDKESEKFNFLG